MNLGLTKLLNVNPKHKHNPLLSLSRNKFANSLAVYMLMTTIKVGLQKRGNIGTGEDRYIL